ncbi:MAG TPA: hypothetical protein IGR64_05310 [Leptolyngbyaceae cyanobacterium M65_K2018_010]|nr:hypothetical protein [Leptolyngbyaceae cyanobacterium M65_K2018_010]
MALVEANSPLSQHFSRRTIQRAERAFKCSPFRLDLLLALQGQSISIRQICHPQGLKNGYSRRSLSELQAENELMWLIAVGLLRREVDGQGLTDRFRLTPLGRQVCYGLQQLNPAQLRPTWGDHCHNSWCRWWRRPSWWPG